MEGYNRVRFVNEIFAARHSHAQALHGGRGTQPRGRVDKHSCASAIERCKRYVHGQATPQFGRKSHLYEGRNGGVLMIRGRAGDVQLQQLLQVVAITCDGVGALARIAHELEDVPEQNVTKTHCGGGAGLVHFGAQTDDADANSRVRGSLG